MKWPEVTFSELFRVKHGFAFKSEFFAPDGPFVLLTPGSFNEEGGFREQGAKTKFYTGDVPNDFILAEGDLLVAMTEQMPGLLGSSLWVPESNRFLHNQRLGKIIGLDERRLDRRFLFYLFNTRPVRQQISGSASGTKVRHTAPERIGRVRVQLPSLADQRTIAATLTAYDELLEINERRMTLLEEAARLLYREWFVRHRFPGHEHTRITNGVPEGWMPMKLSEFIDVTHGYAFDGEQFADTPTTRVLTTPGNFRIGGGIKIDKLKYCREESDLDADYILAPMDLIVTMTDLSQMSDTLGYPAFVPKLDDTMFLHNQRVGRVVPRTEWFPKHFFYSVMCDARYRNHVVGSATGTSVKHTAPKRILSYAVTMPTKRDLVNRFDEVAAPIFEQINQLLAMNEKLRAARDLLLPRLMSGEIAV